MISIECHEAFSVSQPFMMAVYYESPPSVFFLLVDSK